MTKKNELDEVLNSTDPEVIKKLKSVKGMNKLIRLFNNGFCGKCKVLAYQNSMRPMSDYCLKCQLKANKVLEEILK